MLEVNPHFRDQAEAELPTATHITRMRLIPIAAVLVARIGVAQQLTPAERARIDSSVNAVLAATGAPSASVAIVRGAAIVYTQAYGDGRIDPKTTATDAM